MHSRKISNVDVALVQKDLKKCASKKRKKKNEWFFKTEKGQYGAHDRFLGVSNPDVRRIAKRYYDLEKKQLHKLIHAQYNEERFCALVILIHNFEKKTVSQNEKKEIYNFYVKNLRCVNNWNLVDISVPHILGEYIVEHQSEKKILNMLVRSDFHWYRRACILATWAFIKRNNFEPTLYYATELLSDREDLMHKAVGWMLREVYKRDEKIAEQYLQDHYDQLPRTTLRYAIERMDEKKRKEYLHKIFSKK